MREGSLSEPQPEPAFSGNGKAGGLAHPSRMPRIDIRTVAGLAALCGVGLALRCWALTWGLPNSGRYYPYHPDESVMLNAVCRVNPLWLEFAPTFYNYGSLTILLTR